MAQDDSIERLARQIEAVRKAERFYLNAHEVASLRRQGACELHRMCTEFVGSVNSTLTDTALDLSPATFAPATFRETGINLFQIGSQGREMQIAFEAAPEPFSTEKFLVPYIMEGEIRTYNQRMLERFEIRSQLLFFCVSETTPGWRFFDWRTRHTGPVDRKLLVSLMESLF
uniref:Uncharacterized protein n=1 Tax=Solibacter usitatus (strain Ellin6076) TaxID=234267 RepID=Q01YH0_SOLUE